MSAAATLATSTASGVASSAVVPVAVPRATPSPLASTPCRSEIDEGAASRRCGSRGAETLAESRPAHVVAVLALAADTPVWTDVGEVVELTASADTPEDGGEAGIARMAADDILVRAAADEESSLT